ncbi:MAG: ComEC family DNA internalization-related competence protein [Clostridia bacterium]|nr:ComEC family DNA internalization-related competence protein [Clostridia bacterium]
MNKRPMLIITIGYLIGILLGLYLDINIALFVISFIVTTVMLIYIYVKCRKKGYKENIILIVISTMVFLFSTLMMHYREKSFEIAYDGSIKCVGTIISVEMETQYYYSYTVKVKNVSDCIKLKDKNILLRIKKTKDYKAEKLEYGDLISITGKLEKPSKRKNYKGYDYSEYLKIKNIYFICNTNIKDVQVLKKNSLFVVNVWITKLRNRLKLNLFKILPKNIANIAIAFLLGDSNFIEEGQKQIFSDASLSHILAISGMHVSYIILGCSYILKKLGKRYSKYRFNYISFVFFNVIGLVSFCS